MSEIVTVGWLTLDDIILPDRTYEPNVIGGGALYSAIGARIWHDSVGIHSVTGWGHVDQIRRDIGEWQIDTTGISAIDGNGLHPSSKGARVRFSGASRTVVDGPFPETKELIAGFWIFKVDSKEEAIEWVKRCPNPMPGTESEIEIRQIFEAEDFGAEFTPELREQEDRLRAEIAAQQ